MEYKGDNINCRVVQSSGLKHNYMWAIYMRWESFRTGMYLKEAIFVVNSSLSSLNLRSGRVG